MSLHEEVRQALLSAAAWNDFDRAASQVLRYLGLPDQLLAFTDLAVVQAMNVRPRGYLHSNGFLKVEYLRVGTDGLRLRAHYWHRSWGSVRQNPHDHAFDFRSRVVLGTFLQRRFEIVPAVAGGYSGYRYSRLLRDGVEEYQLQPGEPAKLVEVSRERISAPTEYSSAGRRIHTLDPIDSICAATVLVSRPDNQHPWSNVFSTDRRLNLQSRNARELSQADLLDHVRLVLGHTEEAGGE